METPSRRSLRGIAALALAALVSGSAVSAAGAAGAAPSRPSTAVPSEVRAIFQKPMYAKGVWGLRVLDGKNVLVDYNSQRPFYIGSVRKVFSVGQLLNAVGPATPTTRPCIAPARSTPAESCTAI